MSASLITTKVRRFIIKYNQKVEQFNAANDTLVDYLTDVEESGVQDEQPYDPEVMEKFKAAVVNA